MSFQNKYLKYKNKYLELKKQIGGASYYRNLPSLFRVIFTLNKSPNVNQDLSYLQTLVEEGADVKAREPNQNRTLLHTLFGVPLVNNFYTRLPFVDFCIKHGVDINATDNSGDTALIMACSDSDVNVIKKLLDNGANINMKNPLNGNTPLITATAKKYVDVVKLLMESGADVNARNKLGKSALDIANNADIIKLLNTVV